MSDDAAPTADTGDGDRRSSVHPRRRGDGHRRGVGAAPGRPGVSRRTYLRLSALGVGAGVGLVPATRRVSGGRVRRQSARTTDRWFGGRRESRFRSVLETGDGYLLTGIDTSGRSDRDAAQVGRAVKLDDDLGVVWDRTYVAPRHREATDDGENHSGLEFALADGTGGYLLAGWHHDLGPDSRYGWLTGVDGGGDVQWSREYYRRNVNSFRDDFAGGVATDDGYLLVGRTLAGDFLDEETGDGWVVDLSRTGRVRWERAYDADDERNRGFDDDEHHDEFLAVVPAGRGYLVAGETTPVGATGGATSGWLVRLGPDGDVRWRTVLAWGGGDGRRHEFVDLVRTSDGGFLVAATVGSEESVRTLHDYQLRGDAWVVKVDGRGRTQWERSPGGTRLNAVTRADDGYVFAGARGGRGWTVTYDEDGTRLDEATPSGDADEYAGVVGRDGGHLLVGHGQRGGTTAALVTDVRTDDGGGDGDDAVEGERLLEIVGREEGNVYYEFTVDGEVERARVDDRVKAEETDRLVPRGDGAVTVVGITGNRGFGDAFRLTGDVTEFTHTGGDADFELRVDGERVDTDDLVVGDGDDGYDDVGDVGPDGRLFEIVGREEGDVHYEFTVEGEVVRAYVDERVKAEEKDRTLRQTGGRMTVVGDTGNRGFGDAFRFSGEIVGFVHTGGDADFELRVDGERVDPDRF